MKLSLCLITASTAAAFSGNMMSMSVSRVVVSDEDDLVQQLRVSVCNTSVFGWASRCILDHDLVFVTNEL